MAHQGADIQLCTPRSGGSKVGASALCFQQPTSIVIISK